MKPEKELRIRNTKAEEIETVLALYERARVFMAKNGNASQWAGGYPARELVMQDICENNSYVCLDREEIIGVFYFSQGPDKTYETISEGAWLNEAPYGVMHRIAVGKPGVGVAAVCFDWCLNKCGNLRIDTHANNVPMQKSLAKSGFVPCGIIRIGSGEDDRRIAYQKAKEMAKEIHHTEPTNGKSHG